MRQWIIADTHWYHDRIASLCGRPVNHTELSIKNCQEMIGKDDILYHIGDVIFYRLDLLAPILSSIPGRKVLVSGNHDMKRAGWYIKQGFSDVCSAIFIRGCLLSHKPLTEIPGWAQYNVFGHVHNSPWIQTDPRQIKFSLEEENYKPVQLNTLLQRQVNQKAS